jgi:hypothetical protein
MYTIAMTVTTATLAVGAAEYSEARGAERKSAASGKLRTFIFKMQNS